MEVDSLSYRITNIHQAYFNTSHVGLRDRLFYEDKKKNSSRNYLKKIIFRNKRDIKYLLKKYLTFNHYYGTFI